MGHQDEASIYDIFGNRITRLLLRETVYIPRASFGCERDRAATIVTYFYPSNHILCCHLHIMYRELLCSETDFPFFDFLELCIHINPP